MGTFADDTAMFATHDSLTKSPGTPPRHTELATKMENKSKRKQIITYNIHRQERQLPCNTHQSNIPTTGRIRKVLMTTLRSQTELESAHYQETETN